MRWRSTRLGDVITLQRGHDLPEARRRAGDVPVVSSSGITGSHSEAKARAPGVVTGRYGTIGEVFFVDRDYWPLNTALYVTDFKGNDPRFVAYLLRNALRNHQSDKAAVPGVNRNVLHEMPVLCPDKKAQRRIASILSAYDDLIENNRRRMKLLEAAARQLYREWFVRLRFPGHERVKIKDGLPEGWERAPFGEIAPDCRELAQPGEAEPDTPHIGLEHMPRRSITLTEWGTSDEVTSTKLRYRAGDILFGKIRPYFHKVGFALTDGVASSDSIILRPVAARLHGFVLLTASSDWFVAVVSKTAKEGSKMPRADWKLMAAHEISVPPGHILDAFGDVIDPTVAQLKTLAFHIRKLRGARDLLLPKLMSGEVAV